MPEYLSPGVYIEEVNSGPRPIEGVGTAMAAFVGFAPAGPTNQPVLITNWSQYVETFGREENGGGLNPHYRIKCKGEADKTVDAYLSHAVYGYFLNGGGRCLVTRISAPLEEKNAPSVRIRIPGVASSSKQLPKKKPGEGEPAETAPPEPQAKPSSVLKATLKDWHQSPSRQTVIAVETPEPDGEPQDVFTLRVRRGDRIEVFQNLSLSKSGSGAYAIDYVNKKSLLIELAEAAPTDQAESRKQYVLGTITPELPDKLTPAVFEGESRTRSGVMGLEISEDVTMVCCPDLLSAHIAGWLDDEGVTEVQGKMIAHCTAMADRMAILDPLPGSSVQDVKSWRQRSAVLDSKYAALYYPWVKVMGPDGTALAIPPSGHMAGIYARSDRERGVHKAPANEVVRGVLEAAIQITKGEQDLLNPIGVNCIRSFTGRGIRVWGARTLSSDPAWRYINVRRLFNYVEKSIERGTQWVVFEPNDPDLWARVRRDVGAFLTTVWRDGALFGRTPQEAFFVKCDEETNTEERRNLGQLVIEVGLAPVKPAEFVVFRFSQYAGGGAAPEAQEA